MKNFRIIPALFLLCLFAFQNHSFGQDEPYYELRVYTPHPGKMLAMINRFEMYTTKLFEKHGIENAAYFIPTDQNDERLIYILAYPSKEEREKRWGYFANDPEWKEVKRNSETTGPLVAKVEQIFMEEAPDLSPEIIRNTYQAKGIFEMRTYTAEPGKMDALNSRFRDYTRELFQKHGMVNVKYWYTVEADGQEPKLIYLLAHQNEAAAKASFEKFGKDPAWQAVRNASERNGPIVQKVESVYLKALPFSPLQ